jgi:hypothetical protein
MMKSIVKKATSLITFDLPLEKAYIASQFASIHQKYQAHNPTWSTTATRQKLVAQYWYTHVIRNFALMYGLPVALTLIISGGYTQFPSI